MESLSMNLEWNTFFMAQMKPQVQIDTGVWATRLSVEDGSDDRIWSQW